MGYCGNAGTESENGQQYGFIDGEGELKQGLYLTPGKYCVNADIGGAVQGYSFFVQDIRTGEDVVSVALPASGGFRFEISKKPTYFIGMRGQGATEKLTADNFILTLEEPIEVETKEFFREEFTQKNEEDLETTGGGWIIGTDDGLVSDQASCF